MNTKLIRLLAPVAISLVAASGTAAQTSPQQQDRLVIHAGRLLDVKTGHWLTNQTSSSRGTRSRVFNLADHRVRRAGSSLTSVMRPCFPDLLIVTCT